ncbi:hypothetical protein [Alterinioella nitratireducens]|uniref:hypothetical protein n=1 Tax=Alterinioella nitratireducens TaxID=2735915 RepID=UPI001551DCC5|nr:hypothetical protein [Alterinioella nitratireducens]NPD18721.1 hypothetical protein [Alterinioella nitratireducens]
MREDSQTVGSVITRVLPKGTNPPDVPELDPNSVHAAWTRPPLFPLDMFAVAAHLCKVGSVISYFDPAPDGSGYEECQFIITRADRDAADEAASKWRTILSDPVSNPLEFVTELWQSLLEEWDSPTSPAIYESAPECPPDW